MDNIVLNYQGIKDKIRGELNRVAESFVEIGYRLKQVRDGKLYELDGYRNINEFAQAEYNLSQSTTSRFIAINDTFSVNGSSPKLLEQYEGYGYSKLSEMLTLSESELHLVTIRTTRTEIREIKQAKKEAETEIYAPAHNAESLDFTQSKPNFEADINYLIPEADKLLIEFFRDKSRRYILSELAAVLSDDISNDIISKAAELINPSGHLMFRKGMVIMIFEEDHIKYSKFNGANTQFTYSDLFHDIYLTFDMMDKDPWVAFYGEPESDPVPEKIEPVQEKKEIKEKPTPKVDIKKPEAAVKAQSPSKANEVYDEEEEDTKEDEENTEDTEEGNIPGQLNVIDYPELSPQSDTDETVEIVEADIVRTETKENDIDDIKVSFDKLSGEIEVLVKGCRGIKLIRVVDTESGESWEVSVI